jgi:hypothetical protein
MKKNTQGVCRACSKARGPEEWRDEEGKEGMKIRIQRKEETEEL